MLRPLVESGQYTSREFADFCAENGVVRSMGRRATCFDNAVSESFFATLSVPESVYTARDLPVRPWQLAGMIR